MATNENGCPHCGNQFGFAFGTCVECGYNYLKEEFSWVRVGVVALREEQQYLVEHHAQNTRRR